MKRIYLCSLVAMLSIVLSSECYAAHERKGRKHSSSDDSPIEYSQSATESVYYTSKGQNFGLGFSTVTNSIPGTSAAVTGIYNIDRYNAIHAFFSIPQTSPFNVGGIVLYKRTIAESKGAGFHIGGGLGLASVNSADLGGANFAMNLAAIAGFHFELPGIPHVMVHLDGGPAFNLVSTSPSAQTNFQVGALSPALGASVLYIF